MDSSSAHLKATLKDHKIACGFLSHQQQNSIFKWVCRNCREGNVAANTNHIFSPDVLRIGIRGR